MFRFVTKKELWGFEDSGLAAQLPPTHIWHLKDIQDAMAYKYLHNLKNMRIAEVGGGNSRILPILARQNTCFNIEPFDGVGQGPKTNTLPQR